jgi:hypothetical protein
VSTESVIHGGDLQLHSGIAIQDRDGGPAPTNAQLVDREAVRRPIRHHNRAAGRLADEPRQTFWPRASLIVI